MQLTDLLKQTGGTAAIARELGLSESDAANGGASGGLGGVLGNLGGALGGDTGAPGANPLNDLLGRLGR